MYAWFVSLLLAIDMEVRGKDAGVLVSGVEKETHENNTVGIVYAVWSAFLLSTDCAA